MSISKIKKQSLVADAIDATKLADDSISEEHLDVTAITDQTLLDETANESDVLLIYDESAGALKKVLKSNVGLQVPTISSVSPTNVLTGDGTGNTTFTITGTGFITGTTAQLLRSSGSTLDFDSITRDSTTQLTCVIAISSLSNADEPYGVRVTSGNGLATSLTNQININAAPAYTTSAGSLGSDRLSMSGVSVNATDPESAGNITFELQSGSLPPGISLVNTAAEGGTATFSGTFSSLVSSDTVYNFTLRAVDAASNTNSRAFSFTALGPQITSFTASGTFAVPSGISSVNTLVVAGGGGGGGDNGGGAGGGGLIYMPGYPVTPGGTVTVTVGSGGTGSSDKSPYCQDGSSGQDSVFGSPGDPGLGSGGVLTAKGGGGGGGSTAHNNAQGGGSGGGGGGHNGGLSGPAEQPTQPGNSGAYGFGNPGGNGLASPRTGGGGGGAGGAGVNADSGKAGNGGVGKTYSIADGTTPVYYAGGGGGGTAPACEQGYGSPTIAGGGGNGADLGEGVPGTANRGGGGGGGSNSEFSPQNRGGGQGGKGIVIVQY
jgi:hypothetical protein